jgi:putative transposase
VQLYLARPRKDVELVYQALSIVKSDLRKITLFHIDRGNEFKNKVIYKALETFQIKRYLSMNGCPYDNNVAKASKQSLETVATLRVWKN